MTRDTSPRSDGLTFEQPPLTASSWRRRLHEIVFESETRAGKAFDITLLLSILASVIVVVLDSMAGVRARYGGVLVALEWFFTLLFTVEYMLRLLSVRQPLRYATSFFGVVDLLAIVPNYLSVLMPGSQFLAGIRILRLLRVFRILKLAEYLRESETIVGALRASRRKIMVFFFAVVTLVVIIGAVMYAVEGEANGFTSIPISIYWAVVTLTTVGYGDLSPQTPLGRVLASLVMIIGYCIIAVPTGIVTSEFARAGSRKAVTTQSCPNCSAQGHDPDAQFCKYCGAKL